MTIIDLIHALIADRFDADADEQIAIDGPRAFDFGTAYDVTVFGMVYGAGPWFDRDENLGDVEHRVEVLVLHPAVATWVEENLAVNITDEGVILENDLYEVFGPGEGAMFEKMAADIARAAA